MKKFLGLILAAAMVVAGIAPAMAADVELSGEVRVRHEIVNMSDDSGTGGIDAADDWNDNTNSGTNTTTQRTRINAKAQVDDQTTAFISLADVRYWGEDFATANANAANDDAMGVHLNEGWLQIDNLLGPVGIKVGRQRLSYGSERLLGALEWTDTGNRWDALNFLYRSENVDADLFFAEFSNSSAGASDDNLNGLYVTVKNVIPANTLDVYAIQKQTNATSSSNATDADFMTYGLRVAGKAMNIDWDAEYAQQTGEWDDSTGQDQDAAAWAINAGYSIPDAMGLRIGAQAWSADGQDASADHTAFDNLYPTNHFKYGIADVAGSNLSNREGFGFDVSVNPMENLNVKIEYVTLDQEEAVNDGVGDEINVQIKYGLTEKVKLYVYAASFDPDDDYVANGDEYEKVGIQLHAKF